MARMIPSEPDADTPDSERYVFGRLRDRLPASWRVLHSRRFVLPAREGRAAEEGEVDFLVIHPERGLLALEVKGGGVARTPDGWAQTGRDGRTRAIKDPGRQVQGAVHALDRFLRAQPNPPPAPPGRDHLRLPFGWAVVLPDVDVHAALGPDLPRELVLGRNDFADLRGALERAYDAGVPKPGPPLTDKEIAATIRALAPTLRLVRSMASRIEEEAAALVRLTDEQARILDVLAAMPRVAIQGAAGTGKTVLASEWARRLTAQGLRTLLLCFNRPLAEHLARGAHAEGYAVLNFHRLCFELCQAAGVPFEVPEHGRKQRDFWEREAPLLLLQALESRPEALFDAVVVDEGQDFREDWWPAVEALLREPGQGRLVVFYDPHQDLYGGGPAASLEVAPATLDFNCRNTAHIARFARAVIHQQAQVRPGTPRGADVELVHVKSDDETVEEVRRLLHRLIHDEGLRAEQIVVLSTRSRDRSSLGKTSRLGNVALAPFAVDAPEYCVRVGSIHQFKGLEADVILLIDVQAGEPNSSPRHVYVGASRARHLLVVIERKD